MNTAQTAWVTFKRWNGTGSQFTPEFIIPVRHQFYMNVERWTDSQYHLNILGRMGNAVHTTNNKGYE